MFITMDRFAMDGKIVVTPSEPNKVHIALKDNRSLHTMAAMVLTHDETSEMALALVSYLTAGERTEPLLLEIIDTMLARLEDARLNHPEVDPWANGRNPEIHLVKADDPEPTCDICGIGQYHSEDKEWNGSTGNHTDCELGVQS